MINWDAVGAVGEILGAVAVVVTLVYLAIQLRQNTRALTSSTFHAVSSSMGQNMEILASDPALAALLIKAQSGPSALTEEERARFGFVMRMAFRRVETVYVQRSFGFIAPRLTEGFERSALSAVIAGGAREWWEASKDAFSADFASWVDHELATNQIRPIHAGLGLDRESGDA